MKNKGFTLMELLAVIVILSIIALIATPIIIDIIENVRQNSKARSAELYIDAVEYAIANNASLNNKIEDGTYRIMSDGNVCIGTLETDNCTGEILEVKVDGEKPNGDRIIIRNGEIVNYIIQFGEIIITSKDEMLNGNGQSFYTLAPSTLTFRSSAPLSEFKEVKINGEVIDSSYYTLTEGSTIVTLSIDYLKTLVPTNYKITIVSETGLASANFSVIEPDQNDKGFYYNQPYTAYLDYFGGNVAFFIRENGTLDAFVYVDYFTTAVETCTYTVSGNTMTITSETMGTLTGTISPDGMGVHINELATNFVLGDEAFVSDEDYIYCYDDSIGGYVAQPIDKTKSSYGTIRTGINDKPTVAIARNAFYNNTNLVNIPEIPDTVTRIGMNAFYGCTSLEKVILPDSITQIDDNAFQACTNLKSIRISNNARYIGIWAFQGCTSLTSFDIPNNVTMIGDNTFSGCTSLTSVTIPVSLKTIFYETFANCTNLTNIIYKGTIEQWNSIVLDRDWSYNTPATQVVCSDGTVSLK